jgi:hypothetical protein
MLETVLTLLISLGLAVGGVQGVTTAQDHQAAAPAGGSAAAGASASVDAEHASQATVNSLADLISMISDKITAAAAHADEHAQDALAAAATAASKGLQTAIAASSAHGADAADAAGPPDELPGPGDHPGH